MRFRISHILIVIFAMVLAACSTNFPESPNKIPEVPIIPTPPPSVELDQEALKAKWKPAIESSLLLSSTCQSILKIAEERKSGAVDDNALVLNILVHGVGLEYFLPILSDWQAEGDQSAYKQILHTHQKLLYRMLIDWEKDRISSENVLAILDGECEVITNTLLVIVHAAEPEGLTLEILEEINDEFMTRYDAYIVEKTTFGTED